MLVIFTLACVVVIIAPMSVQAYLDPGTGSFIIQLVVGGLLGSSYFLSTKWQWLKDKFKNKKTNTDSHEN